MVKLDKGYFVLYLLLGEFCDVVLLCYTLFIVYNIIAFLTLLQVANGSSWRRRYSTTWSEGE